MRESCVSQQPTRGRSLAVGIGLGLTITTIGLEFALPALLGFGLDRWWSTSPWVTIFGAVLGFAIGHVAHARLATELSGSPAETRGSAGPQVTGEPC